jgi:hypothetical protein
LGRTEVRQLRCGRQALNDLSALILVLPESILKELRQQKQIRALKQTLIALAT